MTTRTSHSQASTRPDSSRRSVGLAFAAITAVVSGFSVFVNGYGVREFDDATTYTTAKNLVAAVIIGSVLLATRRLSPGAESVRWATSRRQRIGLGLVAVIGGSVPFVLFFEGLQRATSTDAAFIHKTLVIWVAIGAALVLRERLRWPHLLAIAFIVAGYAATMGGVDLTGLHTGELLIGIATLSWAAEVILVRSLLVRGVGELTVSTSRMAGGAVVLLLWALLRGAVSDLTGLTTTQWGWALLTGAFLSAFVMSWHFALARAQAVDVTAVLVLGAVITALLNAGIRSIDLRPAGVTLLACGAAFAMLGALSRNQPEPLASP